MKRILSTAFAIALLLSLGGLAVLARGGGSILTPADSVVAAAAQPQTAAAPLAVSKFNMIALPLDSSNQFAYDAAGLLAYVGPSAIQVLSWDPASQGYLFRYADGFGDNFPLVTGGAYWLEVDSNAPATISLLGDVPAQGGVSFALVGDASCKWNQFSVPLNRSDITDADKLLAAIGDAEQVVSWDAASQGYLFRYSDGFGDLFPVKIGYPYGVCMLVTKTWPQ